MTATFVYRLMTAAIWCVVAAGLLVCGGGAWRERVGLGEVLAEVPTQSRVAVVEFLQPYYRADLLGRRLAYAEDLESARTLDRLRGQREVTADYVRRNHPGLSERIARYLLFHRYLSWAEKASEPLGAALALLVAGGILQVLWLWIMEPLMTTNAAPWRRSAARIGAPR